MGDSFEALRALARRVASAAAARDTPPSLVSALDAVAAALGAPGTVTSESDALTAAERALVLASELCDRAKRRAWLGKLVKRVRKRAKAFADLHKALFVLQLIALASQPRPRDTSTRCELLWVDDNPENNANDASRLASTYDRHREGEPAGQAGALLIRWLRANSWSAPVLLYCGDPATVWGVVETLRVQAEHDDVLVATTQTQLEMYVKSMGEKVWEDEGDDDEKKEVPPADAMDEDDADDASDNELAKDDKGEIAGEIIGKQVEKEEEQKEVEEDEEEEDDDTVEEAVDDNEADELARREAEAAAKAKAEAERAAKEEAERVAKEEEAERAAKEEERKRKEEEEEEERKKRELEAEEERRRKEEEDRTRIVRFDISAPADCRCHVPFRIVVSPFTVHGPFVPSPPPLPTFSPPLPLVPAVEGNQIAFDVTIASPGIYVLTMGDVVREIRAAPGPATLVRLVDDRRPVELLRGTVTTLRVEPCDAGGAPTPLETTRNVDARLKRADNSGVGDCWAFVRDTGGRSAFDVSFYPTHAGDYRLEMLLDDHAELVDARVSDKRKESGGAAESERKRRHVAADDVDDDENIETRPQNDAANNAVATAVDEDVVDNNDNDADEASASTVHMSDDAVVADADADADAVADTDLDDIDALLHSSPTHSDDDEREMPTVPIRHEDVADDSDADTEEAIDDIDGLAAESDEQRNDADVKNGGGSDNSDDDDDDDDVGAPTLAFEPMADTDLLQSSASSSDEMLPTLAFDAVPAAAAATAAAAAAAATAAAAANAFKFKTPARVVEKEPVVDDDADKTAFELPTLEF
eukprot:TRINITY_DN48_c0_g4_i2.p1 TRINITY_DN48_c0_g4~~TRINITY_DN48_c0_g4_i2.p1  ORF type:complete len:817 (+),score=358.13 TRINITY_DN48_c0_g4_i2:141-2591(+)